MYQISFEDVERSNHLSKQPGRTAFIDECGNFGFDFTTEGCSDYYILAAIIVENEKISDVDSSMYSISKKHFGGHEIKSSSIGNKHEFRKKILFDMLQIDFKTVILIADKRLFVEGALTEYKKSFMKYLHQMLYDRLYYVYPKLKIVEDETGHSEFQVGFKNYVVKHRPEMSLFNEYDFDFIDSKNSGIIQIADMIAGSVFKQFSDKPPNNYIDMFHSKIIDIINFPNIHEPYIRNRALNSSKYNSEIYHCASFAANSYIKENKDSIDFDKRLQSAFLKYLLFQVNNIDPFKFVSSYEILNVLSEYTDTKIMKPHLYRRIVPQLRDLGIIVATSPNGYKIPTCIDDIYTYLYHTDGVIAPMLKRIEKCRNNILLCTENRLDILSQPDFIKYKKFFD